jgi:MYXO-CTERM domain-containing protein
MTMIAFLVPLATAAPFPCGTIDRLPRAAPVTAADPMPPPGVTDLLVRDPFGTNYDDFELSEHFVLKWGSGVDPTRDQINGALDALEDAWTVAFDDMGFDRPSFTNEFRVNVYIGNSGGDTPDISNAAAYVTLDPEGYAYVVVLPDVMAYFDEDWGQTYARSVLEHEFHHVVQFGASAYYSQEGRWYWEASADWFADHAVPEEGLDAQDAFQFLLLPELSLDYFEPGDLSTMANIHQYSSSVFLIATTELDDGDWTPFRDSWTQAKGSDVPIDVLDALLPNGMASAYTDFARAMTSYDLSFGPTVEDWLDDYGDSSEYHTVTASADAAGSGSPVEINPSLFPGAYAFNVIEMRRPEPGSVIITFVGDATGTRSTPSSFDVFAIAGDTVTDVPLANASGTVEIPDTSELSDLRVVVVSHPGESRSDETFPYALTLAAGEPAPADTGEPPNEWTPPTLPEDSDPVGCNCASTHNHPAAWLAIAALAVSWRRRDRSDKHR